MIERQLFFTRDAVVPKDKSNLSELVLKDIFYSNCKFILKMRYMIV
jgi:hypothetical protein